MMLGCVALAAAGIKQSHAFLHHQPNLTQQKSHTPLLLTPARLVSRLQHAAQVCMLTAQD